MILDGWKQTGLWDVSHAEIIDLADEDTLWKRWDEYFPHDHALMVTGADPYWSSSIARHPRRTGEAKRAASLNGQFTEDIGSCRSSSLAELQDSVVELVAVERAQRG